MLVSIELLSEVLNIPLENLKYRDDLDSYEVFCPEMFNWSRGGYGRWSNLNFNKYELVYKCKVWAFNKGYSYIGNNKLINIHTSNGTIISLLSENIYNWYDIDIDFKACEHILKDIKGNKKYSYIRINTD